MRVEVAEGLIDGELPVVRVEGPMARACADSASFVDFSRICCCFSSSLARIMTRSSGMGLFSYHQMPVRLRAIEKIDIVYTLKV